jgi:hypothetical protein
MSKIVYTFDLRTGLHTGTTEVETTPEGYYTLEPGMTEQEPPAGGYARWSMNGWETVTGEQLRQETYEREADPILKRAEAYRMEAEAWAALEGQDGYDAEKAGRAETNAAEALTEYLTKKTDIRDRYPDTE